jgi:hypothetical protein
MSSELLSSSLPEYNVTGVDFADRRHFRYSGPQLVDIHAHVAKLGEDVSRPSEEDQADFMFEVADDFDVGRIVSMCPPEDIPGLRQRFGDGIRFNGSISKKLDEPDEVAYRLLDRFLELGIQVVKFWAAPRGREQGLFVDAPWRIEAVRRARAAGVRVFMVHVADPDVWFKTVYADAAKFGAKAEQYVGLERLLQMFPDVNWIAAHMGGDPEHTDHLQALLERYPHLSFDTSATKWQVREVSAHRDAIRSLILRFPDRFLFGSDLVTRSGLSPEHYMSRYWCQRTLWESDWEGRSPIKDFDYVRPENEPGTPMLRGLALPQEVLLQVYCNNAVRLLAE